MIKISTKGRYGTRFMLQLARNYNNGPMLLKEIAQKEEISDGYLQHIVDALKGSGLIHSNRVGHGGYTLSRPPKEITLKDILSSLEGSISLVECIDTPSVCNRSANCITREIWSKLSDNFIGSLESINLEDIINKKKEHCFQYEI